MTGRRLVHMRIEAVRVHDRHRKDLGDIAALAKSIAAGTLLNPITVTSDGQLIAGQRRLEACRSLGWDQIAAVVADDLDSAVARLTAERDENTERKAMTPEELVRLGLALEELERPRAAERKSASQFGGVHVNTTDDQGKTREKVADAVGMSTTTYHRAKKVVEAAANERLSPLEQELAQTALEEMNTTGNVHGSYRKIHEAGLHLGLDDRSTMRRKSVIQNAEKQRHLITAAAASLAGITHGLKKIEQLHPQITSEEAAQWVGDLSETRRVIETLIKRLKERSNA